jgi:GntR family transcriptional repressor for pyruvate dehydrogenase complex
VAKSDARSEIRLTPMEAPKASDMLANELRERILSGEHPDGTQLPPERELVAQTRMSRTTVREALRILEAQGLIKIKAGRTGGAFIQQQGEESVARSLELRIRSRHIGLESIHETREAIEPACARLAAVNRTVADLRDLGAANDAMAAAGDLDEFLRSNVDWHVAVAAAGHNEILTGITMALSRVIYAATNNGGFVTDEIRALAVRAHRSGSASTGATTRRSRSSVAGVAWRRWRRPTTSRRAWMPCSTRPAKAPVWTRSSKT